VEFLLAYGNVIGHRAHMRAEADNHYMNEFGVMVGTSSKSRKGSSWGQVRRLFERVDDEWTGQQVQTGLSSGEGLIWAVRDPVATRTKPPKGKTAVKDDDNGIADKRLLVIEQEFASTLRIMARDGNSLSGTIRNAWDSGTLRTMSKNSPCRATGAHISIIGHVTKDELLRTLADTEAGNGFGNRFLWVCVRRSKELPEGGNLDPSALNDVVKHLNQAVLYGKSQGSLQRDQHAKRLWADIYHNLSEGKPGLMGAMIGRSEAHVLRLSCLYALLDMSSTIKLEHLDAALAVWAYCEGSARYVFGSALGDPTADEVLQLLKDAHPEGVTRTAMSDHFKRNKPSHEIARALRKLQELGTAYSRKVETGERGRDAEVWFYKYVGATKETN
jgi:hypothetical protein